MKYLFNLKLVCFMLALGRVLMSAELSSLALDIECQSFPENDKLEMARVKFVKAKSDYKEFYSENKLWLDRMNAIIARQSALQNPRLAEESVSEYRALAKEISQLTKRYNALLEDNRRLKSEYDYAMMLFTSRYGRSVDLSGSEEVELRTRMKLRLGFQELSW